MQRFGLGLPSLVLVATASGGARDRTIAVGSAGLLLEGLAERPDTGVVVGSRLDGDRASLTIAESEDSFMSGLAGAGRRATRRKCERTSAGARAVLFAAVAALAACGGSAPEEERFTIGGSVSGLTAFSQFGPLTLQNNGSPSLTVAASGAFSFPSKVRTGRSYAVTVVAQPAIQTCTVANGTGTANADVANIAVTCVTNTAFSLGGTVGGLAGTLVLRDGSVGQDVTIGANGSFAFATAIPMGAPYAVTVRTQPNGQTCTVGNGAGTMGSANVTSVSVACTDLSPGARHSVGGTVSGLSGGSLHLGLTHSGNMGTSIDVSINGPFSFDPDRVFDGDQYFVTIASQPAGQTCSLTNGTGTAAGDVTNIAVTCVRSSTRYSVGGVITGLNGVGLRIESDAGGSANPQSSAMTFTLPTQFANGALYDVGIAAQPAGQTCVITGSLGLIASADVTNVLVTCIDNVTDPLVGTYTALRAPGSPVEYLTFFADGVYIYGDLSNSTACRGGVEYGVYDYDSAASLLTIKSAVVDSDVDCGLWAGSESSLFASITGSGQGKVISLEWVGDYVPVASTAGQLYGSFTDRYHKNFWLFLNAGGGNVHFFNTQTQADAAPNAQGYESGVESACGAINGTPASGTLNRDFTSFCQAPRPGMNGPIDTNGTAGLSGFFGSWSFDVRGDSLTTSSFDGTRVVPN